MQGIDRRHTDTLYELFDAIQTGERNWKVLLEKTAGIFEADGASLFLVTADAETYEMVCSFGTAAEIPDGVTIKLGVGLAGRALEQNRVVTIQEPHPTNPNLHSSLIVPLSVQGRAPVGALNLSRSAKIARFDDEHVHQAATVATALTFLFENAHLVQRLGEGKQNLQAILNGLSISTFIFDAAGELSVSANDGRHLLERDEIKSLVTELKKTAFATRKTLQQRIQTSDSRTYNIAVIPLAEKGHAVTVEDVTSEVAMQQQFNQNQRLAEIGQMTATIAHEIRNPLTSIKAVGQMIGQSNENAEFAQMILEEVEKLSHLCDQFLDFARPIALSLRKTDLAFLLARLVESCQADAEQHGVKLKYLRAARTTVQPFLLDAEKVEQVGRNLILNAIQASRPGSEVAVVASGHGFRVCDAGTGIPKESRESLFTPFFTTKAKGTGLGLCRVKKIVEAHHGSISFQSSQAGTQFNVEFPLKAA